VTPAPLSFELDAWASAAAEDAPQRLCLRVAAILRDSSSVSRLSLIARIVASTLVPVVVPVGDRT